MKEDSREVSDLLDVVAEAIYVLAKQISVMNNNLERMLKLEEERHRYDDYE